MEAATTKEMGKKLTSAFMLIISMLLSVYTLNAYAQPQAYINSGEQQLYTESINGILEAYAIFNEAKTLYPNDPVINAYLAFTRLLYVAFTYDSVGITPLLNQYGISRTGSD